MAHASLRRIRVLALCAAAGCCVTLSSATADTAVPNSNAGNNAGNPALDQLLATYPGLTTTDWNGRVMAIAGVPMTSAQFADDAAATFVATHIGAFGAGDNLDLRLSRVNELREVDGTLGNKVIYAYDQFIDGLPVEYGAARVLVLNSVSEQGRAVASVTFASGKLAQRPANGFAPVLVSKADAVESAREIGRFAAMDVWSEPEQVVFFGEGDFEEWTEPSIAYKFVGEHSDVAKAMRWTFFVDANTGELIHARNDILHADITGQVRGLATPNNDSDRLNNPPALRDVPEIQVRVQGSPNASVWTDRNGNFTIPWTGTTPVTLEVGVANGRRVTVNDAVNAEILVTQSVTPGTPALIQLNTTPSEGPTSQMNAFIHQTLTRNFFRDRAPTFTALDAVLPANVMVSGSCNAFYNGTSTNFYPAAGGCNNTAIPSVVAHEYGHHIVNRLGLAQGAFGEGFSDTMALLIYNDQVVGRGFTSTGGLIRNPDTANQQFPCSSTAIHTCGQIIGGVTWDIRTGLINRYGSTTGLETARQTHVSWALVTLGGQGLNSAHPTTALEYLSVDDNDGTLCNGTPNYTQIRQGFVNHGITVPGAEPRLTFARASTVPTSIFSSQTWTADFDITPGTATFSASDVFAAWRPNTSVPFSSVPMQQVGPNRYRATFTGGYECGDRIEMSVRVNSSAGVVVYPFGCDVTGPFTTDVFDGGITIGDSFETANTNWVVGPDTASAGNWTRGNPIGTSAQPEDDATPGAGVNCWFTGQGSVGGAVGAADIDNGSTILTSPVYTIGNALAENVRISYNRWFSNGTGQAPYLDTFLIEGRIDGGAWQTLELVGPGSSSDPNTNPGWIPTSYTLAEKGLSTGNTLQLRFTARDLDAGSLVEAAIDDLSIQAPFCEESCDSIDFNNDQLFPDDADLIAFLNVLGGGSCATCNDIDFNNDGLFPDDTDLVTFLRVLAGGPCE
jgi:hypothetical protein